MNMAWIDQWLWLTGFSPSIFLPFHLVPSCVGCWGGAGLTPEAQNKYIAKMHRCRFIRGHFFQFHYLTLKRNSMCSFVLASYRWRKYDMIWYDMVWYHAHGMMICWNSFSHGHPANFQPFWPGNVVLPRADWRIKLISICYPEGLGCWDLDGRIAVTHGTLVLALCQCSQFIRSAGNGLLCGQIDVLPHNCAEDWSQHHWGCFGPLSNLLLCSKRCKWVTENQWYNRLFLRQFFFCDGFWQGPIRADNAAAGGEDVLAQRCAQTLPNLIGCIMLCLWPCPACADLMKLAVANLITCFLFGGFRFCTTHIVSDSAW